jgi:hypothetical protein
MSTSSSEEPTRRVLRSPSRSCATSAPTNGVALTARRAHRRRYPGCPDGFLASPAGPDCALTGEWEAGSRTPLCDRSRNEKRASGSRIGENASQNPTEPRETTG